MPTTMNYGAKTSRAGTSTDSMRGASVTTVCPPPCPACGGLECLCRPRFFPGQLLTADDLRRLDRYIVEKSKLHNRYMHGWGVVCGLEVVCDSCASGSVTVRAGYALSPCGEDIVVCRDASVPVCELIGQCRTVRHVPDCDPPRPGSDKDCTEGIDQWVLAICYDETPSRGVMAVRACGCNGGGGSAGGCGCGGNGNEHGATGGKGGCGCTSSLPSGTGARPPKRTSAQCEPTLTCEGYRFKVYPAPRARTLTNEDTPRDAAAILAAVRERFGPLMGRIFSCMLRAREIAAMPEDSPKESVTALQTVYTDYLEAVRDFAAEHPSHNCEIQRKLALLDRPTATRAIRYIGLQPASGGLTHLELTTRVEALDAILEELVRECICSALLPPCPGPVESDCVPIATVTVQRGECRVSEVCNWDHRKFAVTVPGLSYWLSWLPFGQITKGIAKLCCTPLESNANLAMLGAMLGRMTVSTAKPRADRSSTTRTPFAGEAPEMAQPGVVDELREESTPEVSPRDAELGPLFAVAARSVMPDAMADWLMMFANAPGKAAPVPTPGVAGSGDLQALHARVAELERRVVTKAPPPAKKSARKTTRKRPK